MTKASKKDKEIPPPPTVRKDGMVEPGLSKGKGKENLPGQNL